MVWFGLAHHKNTQSWHLPAPAGTKHDYALLEHQGALIVALMIHPRLKNLCSAIGSRLNIASCSIYNMVREY